MEAAGHQEGGEEDRVFYEAGADLGMCEEGKEEGAPDLAAAPPPLRSRILH